MNQDSTSSPSSLAEGSSERDVLLVRGKIPDIARIEVHANRVLGVHLVPGLEVDATERSDGISRLSPPGQADSPRNGAPE